MIRIALTGENFRQLVAGKEVTCSADVEPEDTVFIILSDIGFAVMRHYIDEAEKQAHEKEKQA